MSDLLYLHNRPTEPGFYRTQINFKNEVPYNTLKARINNLGGRFAYAPGKTAEFGVFAAKDAKGKLRFLDSVDPISQWDWPEGSVWLPGAAIAHFWHYQQSARPPSADYMILYMNIKDKQAIGPKSPDGGNPVLTVINKKTRSIIQEITEQGKAFLHPFTSQQKQTSGPGLSGWNPSPLWLVEPTAFGQAIYPPWADYGPSWGYGAPSLGAAFLLPFLAKLGFIAIDALIVYLMYVSGVFGAIADVFFNFLGIAASALWPLLAIGAAGLVGWSLLPDPPAGVRL